MEPIDMKMRIDNHNQWFVFITTVIGKETVRVDYKVDTGCNGLILSHPTRETHDLLGAPIMQEFEKVNFNLNKQGKMVLEKRRES